MILLKEFWKLYFSDLLEMPIIVFRFSGCRKLQQFYSGRKDKHHKKNIHKTFYYTKIYNIYLLDINTNTQTHEWKNEWKFSKDCFYKSLNILFLLFFSGGIKFSDLNEEQGELSIYLYLHHKPLKIKINKY